MFVVPDTDPSEYRATISTLTALELIVVGVSGYQQAIQVSQELIDQGVQVIEPCRVSYHPVRRQKNLPMFFKIRLGYAR
jgi:hypothetical protein